MATSASDAERELITFRVDGDWSVADLMTLLGATQRIYDALYAAALVGESAFERPFGLAQQPYLRHYSVLPSYGVLVGTQEQQLKTTPLMEALAAAGPPASTSAVSIARNALATLSPEGRLRIRRIEMASPGVISLEGSGEVIDETRRLIEGLTTLDQTRKGAKLRNEAIDIENERRRHEAQRDAALDEVAVARERLRLIEDVLTLRFGAEFRSVPGVDRLLDDVLSGAADLRQLMTAHPLALTAGDEPSEPAD
ncbi:MAG: hypothetical protein ACTHOE_10020 [Conexibacter sp.]